MDWCLTKMLNVRILTFHNNMNLSVWRMQGNGKQEELVHESKFFYEKKWENFGNSGDDDVMI